ncbi:MAG: TolC family protein [Candidatus Gastranaerophilaceae bacterium]
MREGNGKPKNTNRIFITMVLILIFIVQTPAIAFWGNKPLPPIKVQEKINYVNINWWDNFSDPYLKCYIVQAITNNHDARKASWKVEEYRQMVKLQFSQELPSLSVGGTYVGAHFPDTIKDVKSNIFAIPFIASYEADIFLKNRDKTKSSKKSYESSKFQEQSIYISLASDVATAYINVIKFDKQIELQQELVNVKKEELSRDEAKYKRGTISASQLNTAQKDYKTAQSGLDEFLKSRDKALNQLAVLIGDSPDNIANFKRGSFDNLEYKIAIPNEISSDAVFSRPDILAAEKDLEKAKIDVRVARKEFLPRINVNGIYSLSNVGSSGFGSWNSTIAAIAASATMDLFKGGMKVANLKISKSRYEQMFEAYRQTDLTALKEVNDSLIMIKQDSAIDNNAIKNLGFQRDNYRRSDNRYKSGVISYPNLLSEREQLLNTEQTQINTKTTRLINYITLYKAVGGNL